MSIILKLENKTPNDLLVQVELTGITATIPPLNEAIIDTDCSNDEEVHLEICNDRIIIWGGVAATIE